MKAKAVAFNMRTIPFGLLKVMVTVIIVLTQLMGGNTISAKALNNEEIVAVKTESCKVAVRMPSNLDLRAASRKAQERSELIGQSAAKAAKISINRGIVRTARELIGPRGSFDCSLYVQHVMAKNNIEVPRTTFQYFGVGTEVDAADLQEGDIVLYDSKNSGTATHVGIYVGDGNVCHVNTNQGRIEETPWRLAGGRYPIVTIRRFT